MTQTAKYRAHALSIGIATEVFHGIEYNLGRLGAEVAKSKLNKKNFRVLMLAADMVRELGGARITSCKSAKDRTSMAVTHEEVRMILLAFKLCPFVSLSIINIIVIHSTDFLFAFTTLDYLHRVVF